MLNYSGLDSLLCIPPTTLVHVAATVILESKKFDEKLYCIYFTAYWAYQITANFSNFLLVDLPFLLDLRTTIANSTLAYFPLYPCGILLKAYFLFIFEALVWKYKFPEVLKPVLKNYICIDH
jgi:hypothetical protein